MELSSLSSLLAYCPCNQPGRNVPLFPDQGPWHRIGIQELSFMGYTPEVLQLLYSDLAKLRLPIPSRPRDGEGRLIYEPHGLIIWSRSSIHAQTFGCSFKWL